MRGTRSAVGLVGELATALGVPLLGGDLLPGVLARLSEAPAVMALDNLETPWEADTLPVEELLALIASVEGVALVASLRGAARPGGVRWARPTQLEPLELRAARNVFLSLAPERFDAQGLDELLEDMGGVPLAIELLAHAADGESTLDRLAQRWRVERIRLLSRGAVDTSWRSPAMTEPARRLLSLMGQLPDGIAHDDIEPLLARGGSAAASQLRRMGLAFDQAGRLRTLPPVRHHLAEAHRPDENDWQHAIAHYGELADSLGNHVGRPGGGEAITRLRREAANITATVMQILAGEHPERGYPAVHAFINAARFSGIEVAPIADSLLAAAQRTGDPTALANAEAHLGHLALARSDHDGAREAYERALPLYQQVGAVLGEANCIQCLGDIALARSDHDGAREAYERALPLYTRIDERYSIGQSHRSLARLESDHLVRCGHVSKARHVWMTIERQDLVAELYAEFDECDQALTSG